MGKLFGTDGVRGIVSTELDALLSLKIGSSTARVLKETKNHKIKVLIGSDTRLSKDVLKHALIAGILGEDADVIDLGVIPTPAVSHLIKKYNADGGFVISASHNPSEYNGIKVFNDDGMKLPDEVEDKIESIILGDFEVTKEINKLGTYTLLDSAKVDYVDLLSSTTSEKITGIKIGLDTANGASYETAKMLFDKLGIEYKVINDNPDGININDKVGSTHIEGLKKFVVDNNLDCGIAFDGDADRCIMVDELGNIVDGDKILAICGKYLKEHGLLKNNTIVGTIMSNMGLPKFCLKYDIDFVATKVGDRYVLENMLENDYIIGGEQSGHIIFKDYANTGDGEITALQVLKIMSLEKKSLSVLASIMDTYPQVLRNVDVSREGKEHFLEDETIKQKIQEITESLGSDGRLVIRPSGTENLIRIMLEGKNLDKITSYCNELVELLKEKLN